MRWLSAVLALMLLTVAAGCTYSKEEPGLFRPPAATEPPPPPVERRPLERTNLALPVVGEAIWTTGDGSGVTTRFAVHSVRRIKGATVLDWSVTPLMAPGLSMGDDLPTRIDLGLSREVDGAANIFLLDAPAGKVYRPLSHRSRREVSRCLCSPLWVAQLSLRIGETRMLQITYPELPASTRFIDVDLINVPVFRHVPLTPIGQVPTATRPTDLSRPVQGSAPLTWPRVFDYPHEGRQQSIRIDEIIAGDELTSVVWTLQSVTDQPSFRLVPYGPPISAKMPDGVAAVDPGAASGLQVRVRGGPPLKVRWMTVRRHRPDVLECLCSDLGLWASSLMERGGRVTVTSNFPALPAGTALVDVAIPGVATLPELPVVPAADAADRSGAPVPGGDGRWTYQVTNPPRGWFTQDWPTPVPEAGQLADYVGTVEDLVDLPGS